MDTIRLNPPYLQSRILVMGLLFLVAVRTSRPAVIGYSQNCTGPFSELDLFTYACTKERGNLTLVCPKNDVVVATICLGESPGGCAFNTTNCHGEYSKAIMGTSPVWIEKVKECLWKNSSCDLSPLGTTFIWNREYVPSAASMAYHYVAVFNMSCVSADSVFDVCANSTHSSTTVSNTGYVMSPNFPRSANHQSDCSKRFTFGERKSFDFLIQFIQLGEGDFVGINALEHDGSVTPGGTWSGDRTDYQNYSLEAHGFEVVYQTLGESRHLNEFLLSYTVTAAKPTSPQPITTTTAAATTTDNIPCHHPGERTPLEKAGIAMSVVFSLTFVTLFAVLLLYIRARIQMETETRKISEKGHTHETWDSVEISC